MFGCLDLDLKAASTSTLVVVVVVVVGRYVEMEVTGRYSSGSGSG